MPTLSLINLFTAVCISELKRQINLFSLCKQFSIPVACPHASFLFFSPFLSVPSFPPCGSDVRLRQRATVRYLG